MSQLKKHAPWIVAGLLAFYGILSLMISSQESAIYDERAHIPAAYSSVRYGDMRLNPEHPPLLKNLVGLPLLLLDVEFPVDTPEWQTGINEQWVLGDLFLNCTEPDIVCNDSEAILFLARIPIILIALLLGLFLFLWGRELGGTLAGLIALSLFVFDPNIIAHGHYVTTDIGIAAFMFFAFYTFIRFLKQPTWKNVLLAGIFLGLVELTKFSAVLLFPIFGLFAVVYALVKRAPLEETRPHFRLRQIGEYLGKYAAMVLVCFTLIALFYAFNTWNMPDQKTLDTSGYMFSPHTGVGENAGKRFARHTLDAMVKIPGLDPLAHYFLGVFMVFSRVAGGNTFYFLGSVSENASPSYFPLLFLTKESLPFLFLLSLTLAYTLFRVFKTLRNKPASTYFSLFVHSLQERIAQYLAVFFILFYSVVSITGNLNIGFRHLFPILPFLALLMAKVAADFYQRNKKELGYILRPLAALFFALLFITPLAVYPNYLSYYNLLAGGNKNGYMIATDSNYDWGQDLKHLRDFIAEHNRNCPSPEINPEHPCVISSIHLDYFGGSNPALYLGDRFTYWQASRTPEPGWYAISAVFFQEGIYKKRAPGEQGYEWLRDLGETARAGDSIFIFSVSPEDLSR
jgi:4-amino-4-deoxy-L-arabinose transferase-like glycosyltransferase